MKIIPLISARTAASGSANDAANRLSAQHFENGARPPSNGNGASHNGNGVSRSQVVASCQEDPLFRGLVALAAGSGEDCGRGFTNASNATLLLYCTKGRGWCEIEGKRHEMMAGSLLILLPGARQSYGTYAACPWRITWVQATGANMDLFTRELGATNQRPVLNMGEDPQLLGLFHEILEALAEPCCRPRLIYAAQTLGHLLGLLIWHTKNVEHTKPDLNRRLELSIEYMQQHLAKPLHVASLAALINVSPSYYAVLFKRQTGYSPIDYFIRLRMKQACCLLQSTSLHIKEIAASLGYDDPFYFSRVFKSVVRNSPSEYRQSQRQEEARALLGQAVECGAGLPVYHSKPANGSRATG